MPLKRTEYGSPSKPGISLCSGPLEERGLKKKKQKTKKKPHASGACFANK